MTRANHRHQVGIIPPNDLRSAISKTFGCPSRYGEYDAAVSSDGRRLCRQQVKNYVELRGRYFLCRSAASAWAMCLWRGRQSMAPPALIHQLSTRSSPVACVVDRLSRRVQALVGILVVRACDRVRGMRRLPIFDAAGQAATDANAIVGAWTAEAGTRPMMTGEFRRQSGPFPPRMKPTGDRPNGMVFQ